MSPQEYAALVRKLIEAAERAHPGSPAIRRLHEALRRAVAEHGEAFGLGDDIIAAAAPKNPPDNDGAP